MSWPGLALRVPQRERRARSEAGLGTAGPAHALRPVLLSLFGVLQGCSVPGGHLGFGAGLAGMFWGVLDEERI